MRPPDEARDAAAGTRVAVERIRRRVVVTASLRAVAPLISATQLRERLDGRHVVLLDARSGPGARERYDAQHLAGALFVDLERDLARPSANAANGGRHPLPPIAEFAALLGWRRRRIRSMGGVFPS